MYLITTKTKRKGYYSFSRLIKEEGIKEICLKSKEDLPTKNNLPISLLAGRILIEEIELDDRI